MKLSEETYDIIEEQYGIEVAEYAEEMVNPHNQASSFPNLDGRSDEIGLETNLDQYRQILSEEGLEAALTEFAQDLEKTKQRGVLELHSSEAYET